MKIFNIESLPPRISVGQQTETGVKRIGFDCSEWLQVWPGLSLSLWVTRPEEDAAYPAATHRDGPVLVWDVNDVDTAIPGWGSVEVLGKAEDLKKLSAVTGTRVYSTSTDTTAEPPEAAKPWVDNVLDAAARAEAAADRAESAGGGGSGGTGEDGVGIESITITEVQRNG